MISIFLDYFFCHLVRREREISRMQTFDETIEEFGFQLLLLFQDTLTFTIHIIIILETTIGMDFSIILVRTYHPPLSKVNN